MFACLGVGCAVAGAGAAWVAGSFALGGVFFASAVLCELSAGEAGYGWSGHLLSDVECSGDCVEADLVVGFAAVDEVPGGEDG